jgi:hypothetical protein
MICIPYPILCGFKSRRMRWAGHVARMGEERGAHRVLVGKPEENGEGSGADHPLTFSADVKKE